MAYGAILLAALAGCASPGPPLPPTLNLPELPAADSLRAERIGNTVHVSWTTPERTTDRLRVKGAVTAEICREISDATGAVSHPSAKNRADQRETRAKAASETRPCAMPVARAAAKPGEADEAIDVLPPELASGPPRLLTYRVQLKNESGRTAGPSSPVFTAAGDAPAAIDRFRAHAAKDGVVLEWAPEAGASGAAVDLERTTVQAAGAEARQSERAGAGAGLLAPSRQPAVLKLAAGGPGTSGMDAGGTIDRSVQIGQTYRYTAWRVSTIAVAGQQLEIRGPVSAAVTVPVEDIFPPDAPLGLVAVPGLTGGEAAGPAIEISWEPNAEPRMAGYRVYRRVNGAGEWQRIGGTDLVMTAAYRDSSVASGTRYEYRVTAVGLNGLESPPSTEADETAPEP